MFGSLVFFQASWPANKPQIPTNISVHFDHPSLASTGRDDGRSNLQKYVDSLPTVTDVTGTLPETNSQST